MPPKLPPDWKFLGEPTLHSFHHFQTGHPATHFFPRDVIKSARIRHMAIIVFPVPHALDTMPPVRGKATRKAMHLLAEGRMCTAVDKGEIGTRAL